jgi:hypothetical protein
VSKALNFPNRASEDGPPYKAYFATLAKHDFFTFGGAQTFQTIFYRLDSIRPLHNTPILQIKMVVNQGDPYACIDR